MKKITWIIILFAVTSFACDKEDQRSSYNDLLSFSLEGIDEDFSFRRDTVSAVVNAGTDLIQRTVVFEISDKAKAFAGGELMVSGASRLDFTEPVSFIVEAENGDRNPYRIMVGVMPNQLPVALAGSDQEVFIGSGESTATVRLDASESYDEEDPVINFQWLWNDEVIGTDAVIEFDFPLGLHSVILIVTDALGDSSSDEVFIDVKKLATYVPVDEDAAPETRNLLNNLGEIGDSPQFIFGQEFPMSFQLKTLRWNLNTSDCFDVVNDHPGMFGIDPHYLLYKGSQQRDLHIREAKYAYENGGVVTFDFHMQSRFNNQIYMDRITDSRDKSLMYDIVNDLNGSREWFFDELDIIIDIINNELGFPIVFRLFHEMNGGWFWWGNRATKHSAQLYIDFFRLSADYIRERSNLVLFSWSPNHPFGTTYYPGNDYVDVVGVDYYEPGVSQLTSLLKQVSAFAAENNKVAAFTETGNRNNYIYNHPEFWTNTVLKAIENGGEEIRIAWVLSWFNAPWTSTQSDLFIPNRNSPENAKNSFVRFHESERTLFLNEVAGLKMYE